ncbi:ZIP family metal transporter [Eubacterium oxidoreducens]|uniref:Zinc transporter, ZIP family n=1 Tax=Eubacterium oxidoreducens TaxID=1732 RepID=A0A1G6B5C7_EUBOX|nr:ZIP family metal transporter [Eubacterium oxidoreducens]SDB15848.1 zinc transporter, ZIP family [Eubacterium oxidoreducens]
MNIQVLEGILIPFAGTSLGAVCVFAMKQNLKENVQKGLIGFAAGVMVAASIWSLILPAIEQCSYLGRMAFLPAVIGFWLGILFLLLLDTMTPHLHLGSKKAEGLSSHLSRSSMLVLAVTIHNIPEGIAVGVVYAGWLHHQPGITIAAALSLSLGIAIQNFPEGAIISMPLCSEGIAKKKSFILGILSGIVEPVAALATIAISSILVPALPYLLCFAAGAMLYVVVEELIPETAGRKHHSNVGVLLFAIGFSVMMTLDVALS